VAATRAVPQRSAVASEERRGIVVCGGLSADRVEQPTAEKKPVPADTGLVIVSIALLVARAVRYLGGETLGAKSG
jgi:hypothetical protein